MKKRLIKSITLVCLLVLIVSVVGCASVSTKLMNKNVPLQEQALVLAAQHMVYYDDTLSNAYSFSVFIYDIDGSILSQPSMMPGKIGVVPSGDQSFPLRVDCKNIGTGDLYRTLYDSPPILHHNLSAGGRYVVFGYFDPKTTEIFSNIVTVDEYYEWWTKCCFPQNSNYPEEDLKKEFQKRVLSKFEKAEAALKK